MSEDNKKNPYNFTALLWSIACPGLGHIYLGKWIEGFFFIAIDYFVMTTTHLNKTIFLTFHGEFKQANAVFAHTPTLFFPAIYAFAMWHTYNFDVIARKGNPSEYRLRGFFFGLTIGGVPGTGRTLLGNHILSGLLCGIMMGIVCHFIEKIFRAMKRKAQF